MAASLQRLVIDLRSQELVLRVLYRSDGSGAPNPGTKARVSEVTELARDGLRQALEALQGEATMCGTSGFTQREDLLSLPRPDEEVLPPLPATANKRSRSRKGA